MLRFSLLFVALVLTSLLGAAACAPSSRVVPCENDGQCSKVSSKYHYCLQNNCVECVGNPDCGENNLCVAGTCVRHCKDGRDCPEGATCQDKTCKAE